MNISTFYLPGRVCSTKAIKEIAQKATEKYTTHARHERQRLLGRHHTSHHRGPHRQPATRTESEDDCQPYGQTQLGPQRPEPLFARH